jgi:hypothetical protein
MVGIILLASMFVGVGIIAAWLTHWWQPVAMGVALGMLTMGYYLAYMRGGI